MNKEKFLNRIKFDLQDYDTQAINIIENVYGNRKVIQVVFATSGCNMKKAGSCWNCNYGESKKEFTHDEYIIAFEKKLKEIDGNTLILDTYGSITDSKEFDQNTFKEIVKMAINSKKFDLVFIETHITQISEDLVKYIDSLKNNRTKIEFEVGIEDMNYEHRKLINKMGISNEKLKEVYLMLQNYGINLSINLIYGFPFMDEEERVEAVVNSVRNINQDLPDAGIVLFLMSVKENTKMEDMYKKGYYKLPNPWGLVETAKRILIVNGLKEINGTFNIEERKNLILRLIEKGKSLSCGCYEKFINELENDDGKNYEIRYKKFMNKSKKREFSSEI